MSTATRQTMLGATFVALVIFFVTTFRLGVVRGDSMAPTYLNGQVVLVRRRHSFSAPLRRGDVVLVRKGRDVIIKRVYRLPAEAIDDTFPDVLAYSRLNSLTDYYEQETTTTPRGVQTRYTVPAGYIVILGDNLRVSEDSRIFGPVPISDVLGTVVNAPPPPYAAPPADRQPASR